jgi:16S rRNA (guanine527-N7)-methyltransferase
MEKNSSGLELINHYFGDFTDRQQAQWEALGEVYRTWNEKINVISRKDIDSLYERHVLHSLAIAAVFHFESGLEVLDLGTGGGFPGVPLAIFFPDVNFLLADSIRKKLTVVEEVAAAAGIKNITTRHTRAEEIKDRQFDVVVSRAVAPLGNLWNWSKPLLRKRKTGAVPEEGMEAATGLICLKGGDLTEEIAASGLRPRVWEISSLFEEAFFKEKYIVQARN